MTSDGGAVRFAEKVLALLDEGQFTATYKYAVLLGLLDLSLENVGRHGEPPDQFTTAQLADKVIELYWPHALPFGRGRNAEVLLQNTGRNRAQAAIVQHVQEFRVKVAAEHATGSLVRLRQLAPLAFQRLRHDVEWKLIQMPLPRVQVVGNVSDPFVYEIGWDSTVRLADVRAYQRGTPSSFDNRILLRPGVGAWLIQLNGLLRPLIHRRWAALVAKLNDMEEARLERFLFGTSRAALEAVRPWLLELQRGRCFYCQQRLRGPGTHVDHFIPWSRFPEDGLANLVLADDRCNTAKRDFLAATPHVIRWAERLDSDGLKRCEQELSWDAATEPMRGVARGIYLRLPEDALLWVAGKEFARPEAGKLRRMLE
jgi:5-methylcytosine-specific restriction endonuclease McrA